MSQSTTRTRSTTPDLDDVVEDHGRFVWRVLGRLGVPSADVPDLCQDVFVTVYRRLSDFDADRAALRSWLYGICVRTASDYRRRTRARREAPADFGCEPSAPPSQDQEIERRQARAYLDWVLAGLDKGKREVFVLYELEELTMAEVAEVLGCPLQTAYSRLHAARKTVTEAFRKFSDVRRSR